ncbi:unnamed protein product [Staurois parvus]|uniref:Uncharacterized protein n=1 Tax=Staurois parvus TaxID=386267 RepID=A0ABN9HCL8_9NEOB|nr:unnamed protein product [Staurois parvus]
MQLFYKYKLLNTFSHQQLEQSCDQGRTDNSWGPWAIGDHGAPVSLPKLKKKPMKKVPGASHGAPY